jgi:hypothetical protein
MACAGANPTEGKFGLYPAMKAQMRRRGISLLFP